MYGCSIFSSHISKFITMIFDVYRVSKNTQSKQLHVLYFLRSAIYNLYYVYVLWRNSFLTDQKSRTISKSLFEVHIYTFTEYIYNLKFLSCKDVTVRVLAERKSGENVRYLCSRLPWHTHTYIILYNMQNVFDKQYR